MPKGENLDNEKISEKPVAKLTVQGTTEEVMRQLKGEKDSEDAQNAEKEEKLPPRSEVIKALGNAQNRIVAIRQSPDNLNGKKLKSQFDILCPSNLNEVRDRVIEECGGGRWMIQVFDEEGNLVGGIPLNLKMPPKPVFEENPEDVTDDFGFGDSIMVDRGGRRSMPFNFRERFGKEDEIENTLEEIMKHKKQMLIMNQIDKMMGSEEANNKNKKQRDDDDLKDLVRSIQDSNKEVIASLERKFDEKLLRLESSLVESKYEKQIAELKNMLNEKNATKELQNQIMSIQKDFQNSILSLKTDLTRGGDAEKVMGTMFKALIDSNDKTMTAINSSLNSRVESMQQSNKDFKELFMAMHDDKKSTQKDPMEATKDIISIATGIAGLNRPEVDEVPLTTEDRVIKAITDVTPQVLGFLKDKKNLTEDEIKKGVEERAREIARGVIAQMKSENKQIPSNNPKTIESKEPKKIEAKKEDPKVKIAERVNHVLNIINQEIDVMPLEPEWIDHAFKYLPKDNLVKLAEAEDPKAMLPILKEYANPAIMMEIGFKLMMDKKKGAWLESGLNTLKAAVKEALEAEKNPQANNEEEEEEDDEAVVEDENNENSDDII